MFNQTDLSPIYAGSGSIGSANCDHFVAPAPSPLAWTRVWLIALLAALAAIPALSQDKIGPVFLERKAINSRGTTTLFAVGTKAEPLVAMGTANSFVRVVGNLGYVHTDAYSGVVRFVVGVDVDGDGSRDLFTSSDGGGWFYRVTSTGSVGLPVGLRRGYGTCGAFASGDFNGDGKTDIFQSQNDENPLGYNGSNCPTYVGLGDGAFHFTEVPNSWKRVPRGAKTGDFNRDGKLDLITINTDATLTILFGDGTGKFTEGFVTPCSCIDLQVGDFNRDGNLDAVAATHNYGVSAWFFDGTGQVKGGSSFSTLQGTSSGLIMRKPKFVAAGDFNNDGFLDIAAATSIEGTVPFTAEGIHPLVYTYLGDGTGNFTAAPPIPMNFNPIAMLMEDLNGDGVDDLYVMNRGGEQIPIDNLMLLARPTVAATSSSIDFAARTAYPAPKAIDAGLTPHLPSITATPDQAWIRTALIKDASGNVTGMSVTADSPSLAAGSYTGTVRLEAPGFQPGSIKVNLTVSNPSGRLKTISTLGFPNAIAVAAADFNQDGYQDLVVAESDNKVHVLVGNGGGGFIEVWNHALETSQTTSLALADFNGDGKMDFAVAGVQKWVDKVQTSGFSVWLGTGTAQFYDLDVNKNIPYTGSISAIVAGDFNGDGKMDLAAQTSLEFQPLPSSLPTIEDPLNAFLFVGNGTGRLSPVGNMRNSVSYPASVTHPTGIAAADFDRDGILDIVTVGTMQYFVRTGNGLGNFNEYWNSGIPPYDSRVELPPPTPAQGVAVVNLNGDEYFDIVTATLQGLHVTAGSSRKARLIDGAPANSVIAGDWNGDGFMDIAAAREGGVTIYLGSGDYMFTKTTFIKAPKDPSGPSLMAVADFNNDGKLDMVIPGDGVTILLGDAAPTGSALSTTAAGTISAGTPLPLKLVITPIEGAFNEPMGEVTFYDGTKVLGVMTQASSTYTFNALNLTAGTHSISAKYSGNARSVGSTSNTITVVVK